MGIIGNDGVNYSYDSVELIEELLNDIAEFGEGLKIYAIFKWVAGIKLYVDYDFITPEKPLADDELAEDRFVEIVKASKLLERLKEQDDLI